MTSSPPTDAASAARILTRIARLDERIVKRDAARNAIVAAVSAAADRIIVPALAQRARLVALVQPWWDTPEAVALRGDRKSISLGGCTIGTKANPASLTFTGEANDFGLAQLRAWRGALGLVNVTYSVDKAATLKALDGKDGAKLKAMGFGARQDTAFFVKTVKLPTVGR